MRYETYSRIGTAQDLTGKSDRLLYRFLEALPGVLAWLTLLAIVILSFVKPLWMAVFIIVFDVYWLVKTLFLSLHMRSAFSQLRKNLKVDWLDKLSNLPLEQYNLPGLKSWQDIYHLVILPTYKESEEVITATLDGLLNTQYPKNRLLVVLAQEERAGEEFRQLGEQLKQRYANKFLDFTVTRHPADIPGELAGKGSNATYALRQVQQAIVDRLGLHYDRVLVSNFDIDTIAPAHYFSLLTYSYLTTEKPLHSAFQPIPLYINNIWEAPAFARVFAFSTTFWQMIQQARPEQLVTFSSQSISLQALVAVGYWQTNMVSEDSRIFWQCLLRYDGDWRTVPIYYPVYMDANVAPTFWQTVKNQYKQIRRWHYGVENNPYFLFGFIKNKAIPLKTKWHFIWTTIERTHSSATNALIIFLLGWLPVLVGGPDFNRTILSLNLPSVTRDIMFLSMLGLISSVLFSTILLPPRPPHYGRLRWLWMILQWIIFPINFIFFGAVPALDAQTRLMLGKYMGFWITPKVRKTSNGLTGNWEKVERK